MAPPQELPHGFKLLTLWLVVMAVVFLGFKAWERERDATHFQLQGRSVRLLRAADGHFHWPGRVNGETVDFLVDTGATHTALPASLARQAGLQSRGEVRTQTAGGAARGEVALADLTLDGGVRIERLPVTVLPDLQAPLLGMDVLSKLRFSQQDGELRVEGTP
jgi:aspartyl protease family protein